MIVYDNAYRKILMKYLVPLSRYSVPYRSLAATNIKEILMTKFTSVEKEKNDLIFSFDKDILLKALLGDIELFYIKTILHKQDVNKCNSVDLSANWNIVTNYYYSFFCASLMLRLCFRGNIFLDEKIKRELESVVSTVLSNTITLDSNQFYYVYLKDGDYVLKLCKSEANTHEVVWKKMDELIREINNEATKGSDESNIIKNIIKINSKIGVTYPSKLRNKVNYQPLYGLKAVDKSIHTVFPQEQWYDSFLFPTSHLSSEDNHTQAMYSYTMYIECFCNNLISEYYERQGKENGILKSLNKNRTDKISLPEIKIQF